MILCPMVSPGVRERVLREEPEATLGGCPIICRHDILMLTGRTLHVVTSTKVDHVAECDVI